MRLSKIYTKTGDQGTTSLADGSKVSKTDNRIRAYGTVDELNAFVGVLSDEIKTIHTSQPLNQWLLEVQNKLFDIGGELASPVPHPKQSLVNEKNITELEDQIDLMNENIEPLKNFVLPGGHKGNSHAHVCRTICRRAEREVCDFKVAYGCRQEVISYLNRLSDWFFVISRFIIKEVNGEEVIWNQKK